MLHIANADFGIDLPDARRLPADVVKAWSDAHPQHVPIAIQIELKDDSVPGPRVRCCRGTAPRSTTSTREIRSVFGPADLVTPDDVRGTSATLSGAIATKGWPTIDATRGKVLFTMDNGGVYRDRYRAGHPVLEGRVIFTNSTPGAARRRAS